MEESQSSLPYQMFLALSKWFLPVFVLSEIIIFIFKICSLPYPFSNIVSESFLLVFYIILEYGRVMSGERGNLTEKSLFLVMSIILTLPACVVLVYLFIWQTYVLRIEAVAIGAALTLQAIQALLSLVSLSVVSQSSSKKFAQ